MNYETYNKLMSCVDAIAAELAKISKLYGDGETFEEFMASEKKKPQLENRLKADMAALEAAALNNRVLLNAVLKDIVMLGVE